MNYLDVRKYDLFPKSHWYWQAETAFTRCEFKYVKDGAFEITSGDFILDDPRIEYIGYIIINGGTLINTYQNKAHFNSLTLIKGSCHYIPDFRNKPQFRITK